MIGVGDMYLKRKADQWLDDWKSRPDHNPVIVRGPRQVGKTETIRRFAKTHYENVVEINFVERPAYRQILADGPSADAVLLNLSRIDPRRRFLPGKTLLFFDEIQACPDIATTLKFFRQDGRFDVIASGSLLGISYREIESNSVGYKEDYDMYSMDFEEFLWAKGYEAAHVESMLAHMIDAEPFNTLEMKLYAELFLDYCILGGMPAVVRGYIERGSFEASLRLQRQLLRDYEEDMRKYLTRLDQTRVLNVFRSVPSQLAKENKKFQIGKVAHGARSKDYWGCIEWLVEAGILSVCRCLRFPELPLKGNAEDKSYKLYFRDTGLLVASLDEEAQENLRANRNLGVYKGALYENFAGEALAKSGYPLYYYKRSNATLEMDFLVRTADELIPIEVKAQNRQAKSLKTMIESDSYPDIKRGVKLCAGNLGLEKRIATIPYFCAFLLRRWLREQ